MSSNLINTVYKQLILGLHTERQCLSSVINHHCVEAWLRKALYSPWLAELPRDELQQRTSRRCKTCQHTDLTYSNVWPVLCQRLDTGQKSPQWWVLSAIPDGKRRRFFVVPTSVDVDTTKSQRISLAARNVGISPRRLTATQCHLSNLISGESLLLRHCSGISGHQPTRKYYLALI